MKSAPPRRACSSRRRRRCRASTEGPKGLLRVQLQLVGGDEHCDPADTRPLRSLVADGAVSRNQRPFRNTLRMGQRRGARDLARRLHPDRPRRRRAPRRRLRRDAESSSRALLWPSTARTAARRWIIDDFSQRAPARRTGHRAVQGDDPASLTNMRTEVDGDEASALGYFFEIVDDNLVLSGTYQHRLRREAGPLALHVHRASGALPGAQSDPVHGDDPHRFAVRPDDTCEEPAASLSGGVSGPAGRGAIGSSSTRRHGAGMSAARRSRESNRRHRRVPRRRGGRPRGRAPRPHHPAPRPPDRRGLPGPTRHRIRRHTR